MICPLLVDTADWVQYGLWYLPTDARLLKEVKGMPTITVEGPRIEDMDKRRTFVKALTDAAEEAFGFPPDAYVVLLKENLPENVARGGILLSDRHKS